MRFHFDFSTLFFVCFPEEKFVCKFTEVEFKRGK